MKKTKLKQDGYKKIMEARSEFVKAGIDADKVLKESRKQLEKRRGKHLREGYKATRNDDKALSKEWESTVGDGIDGL